MRVALVISKLFPSGGLQRDCIAIANILVRQGHSVTIITGDRRGAVTVEAPVEVRPHYALNNARRDLALANSLRRDRDRFDRVIGFNKMPEIDVYYCADPPYADVKHGWWHRYGWKYASQQRMEAECFGPQATTSIIVLHERQRAAYRRLWNTPESHFRVIPASLNPARVAPQRREVAAATPGDTRKGETWLAITSAPKVKGLDRTIEALAQMPDARLIVAGISGESRPGRAVAKLAQRLGVGDRLQLLGYREDVVGLMASADLFVHPARLENTGTAILESIVNGLPVVVSSVCGFADNVVREEAGLVVPEPFTYVAFLQALAAARDPALRARWAANGIAYGRRENLTSGHGVAAALMVGALWAR
jgi:UDP-glucose:(heptosyl)LPS alpha-1,3-glucosyltransferase